MELAEHKGSVIYTELVEQAALAYYMAVEVVEDFDLMEFLDHNKVVYLADFVSHKKLAELVGRIQYFVLDSAAYTDLVEPFGFADHKEVVELVGDFDPKVLRGCNKAVGFADSVAHMGLVAVVDHTALVGSVVHKELAEIAAPDFVLLLKNPSS